MKPVPHRFTLRRLMVAVAVVGLLLGGLEEARVLSLAREYRRKADSLARMERRSREIDAMDPATRARQAKEALDNYQEISHAFLDEPEWNRRMIGWFAAMRAKYNHAADNPRLPVPPDPPQP